MPNLPNFSQKQEMEFPQERCPPGTRGTCPPPRRGGEVGTVGSCVHRPPEMVPFARLPRVGWGPQLPLLVQPKLTVRRSRHFFGSSFLVRAPSHVKLVLNIKACFCWGQESPTTLQGSSRWSKDQVTMRQMNRRKTPEFNHICMRNP